MISSDSSTSDIFYFIKFFNRDKKRFLLDRDIFELIKSITKNQDFKLVLKINSLLKFFFLFVVFCSCYFFITSSMLKMFYFIRVRQFFCVYFIFPNSFSAILLFHYFSLLYIILFLLQVDVGNGKKIKKSFKELEKKTKLAKPINKSFTKLKKKVIIKQ